MVNKSPLLRWAFVYNSLDRTMSKSVATKAPIESSKIQMMLVFSLVFVGLFMLLSFVIVFTRESKKRAQMAGF